MKDLANHLDVSVAHPIMSSSSSGDLFSFFSFAGAQCREQQRLPLKFTEFMEGRELWEAVLRETSVAGTILLKIMIFIKDGS
jgi:hypothetical protein